MQSVSAFLSNQEARRTMFERGVIAFVAGALRLLRRTRALVSSPSYGASPKPPKKAAKKAKPKVKAFVHRGQLNVLGTARGDRITLRLKRGNTSRLQVDVGGNGSAEFTFNRSRFNRIVVHAGSGERHVVRGRELRRLRRTRRRRRSSATAVVISSSGRARTPRRGSSSPALGSSTPLQTKRAMRSAHGVERFDLRPQRRRGQRSRQRRSPAQGSAG